MICYPLRAKAVLTHQNVKLAILGIWMTSFITTLPLPIKFTYVATAHFEEVRTTIAIPSFCKIIIVVHKFTLKVIYSITVY